MIESKVYSREIKSTPIYKDEKSVGKALKERKGKYIPYQNIRVELVKEPGSRLIKVSSPADVFNEMKEEVSRLDREYFWVLCLNSQNMVIGINTVSIGTANSAPIAPREIFKAAILVNSINIILAHNHPSGSPEPSREDINVTARLKEAGELLNIRVLDHIIIGDESYYSFMEQNSI